jgi:hypothetical protein
VSGAPAVDGEVLEAATAGFLGRLREDAPWYLRSLLASATIHLWDRDRTVRLTRRGLVDDDTPADAADVALHSSSLLLCMEHRYGLDTPGVSGRFHKPAGGDYRRFYRFFRPGLIAMRGRPVGPGYILGSVLNAVLVRLGRRRN